MPEFDRITRDSNLMAGQACIRGTGIPVYVIANLIMQGMPIDAILERYPVLEKEDILQAMAHTLQEVMQVMDTQHYRVRSAMTALMAGSQLITGVELPEDDEQDDGPPPLPYKVVKDITMINNVVEVFPAALKRGLHALNDMDAWARFYRNPVSAVLESWSEDIDSVIHRTLTYHPPLNHTAESPITTEIAASLPPVQSNAHLAQALGLMLSGNSDALDGDPRPTCHISAAAGSNEDTVQLTIQHTPIPTAPGNREDPVLGRLFAPGTPYATGARTLFGCGGKVEATLNDGGLILRITLPVWTD